MKDNPFHDYIQNARKWLLKAFNKNFLVFCFFLFVSAFFWMLQMFNEEYTCEFRVPLRMENVPDNVVITTEPPTELRVHVTDKGAILTKYLWSNNHDVLSLDFAHYDVPSGHVAFPVTELKRQLGKMFTQPTTHYQSISPDTIEFFYNRGLCKKVPVRFNGVLNTERQHYVSNVRFSPDSVLVYASERQLRDIQFAYTTMVDEHNLVDTLYLQVPMQRTKGVKCVPSKVDMRVAVDMFTEKTVEVPIQGVNFPAMKHLRTFPAKAKVTFQVGVSNFRQINADDFVIAVSYEELMNSHSTTIRLRLRSVPRGASHVRIQPSEVEYLIEDVEL